MSGENILIAGCGRIGTRLGQRLAGAGRRVFGLRRRDTALPSPLHAIQADLRSPELARRLPQAVTTVYIILTPDSYDEQGYRGAYVDAVDGLLAALRARALSPRRLVMLSSTSVYAQNQGEWVDEHSATEPDRFSGRLLLEGEQLLRAAPWPATIVRCAGIYGPGRERLLKRVREGAPCPAHPPVYSNRIHEDDVVGFLAHLHTVDSPLECYLAADDEPTPRHEVAIWLARRLGVEPPQLTDNTDGCNKRCRNTRLRASGYGLRFPDFRAGYAAMLDTG